MPRRSNHSLRGLGATCRYATTRDPSTCTCGGFTAGYCDSFSNSDLRRDSSTWRNARLDRRYRAARGLPGHRTRHRGCDPRRLSLHRRRPGTSPRFRAGSGQRDVHARCARGQRPVRPANTVRICLPTFRPEYRDRAIPRRDSGFSAGGADFRGDRLARRLRTCQMLGHISVPK